MKFSLHHHTPRSLDDTRAQVSQAVTHLSCQIAQSSLSKTIEAARNARSGPVSTTDVLQIAALSASTRHLGQHVDTIRWTTERICHNANHSGQTHGAGARSSSVVSIIQIFSAFSDVMAPLAGTSKPLFLSA